MTTVRLSERTEFHYEISSSQDKGLTGEREEMREGVDGNWCTEQSSKLDGG